MTNNTKATNGNLTVDTDETVTEYFILSEVDNWEHSDTYRPRSLAGTFGSPDEAREAIAQRVGVMPEWSFKVVARTTRKVVTYTEV